jgi:Na+-transporting NADH:ubiquinone oxidoreductase subunit C
MVLGTLSTGLLTSVNQHLKPKIEKNKELKFKSALLDVFDIEYTKENIEEVFNKNIQVFEKDNLKFYKSSDNKIAFEFTGSGLWGNITGIVALKSDLKTIYGIKVIHQEETPGLGGRIAEKEFLSQFKDKKILPQIVIISKGKAVNENEVDGITGATMTSKAFEDILNKNIQRYLAILSSSWQ